MGEAQLSFLRWIPLQLFLISSFCYGGNVIFKIKGSGKGNGVSKQYSSKSSLDTFEKLTDIAREIVPNFVGCAESRGYLFYLKEKGFLGSKRTLITNVEDMLILTDSKSDYYISVVVSDVKYSFKNEDGKLISGIYLRPGMFDIGVHNQLQTRLDANLSGRTDHRIVYLKDDQEMQGEDLQGYLQNPSVLKVEVEKQSYPILKVEEFSSKPLMSDWSYIKKINESESEIPFDTSNTKRDSRLLRDIKEKASEFGFRPSGYSAFSAGDQFTQFWARFSKDIGKENEIEIVAEWLSGTNGRQAKRIKLIIDATDYSSQGRRLNIKGLPRTKPNRIQTL